MCLFGLTVVRCCLFRECTGHEGATGRRRTSDRVARLLGLLAGQPRRAVDRAGEDLKGVRDQLADHLKKEVSERQAADRELEVQVKRWLAGEQGRGLSLTFLGISLTMLGTVAQIAAAMLGWRA